MKEIIITILTNSVFLVLWTVITIASLIILLYDLSKNNQHLSGLMKLVWFLTVLYSGIIGLLIYYFSGRKQIKRDSLTRKAFRSVSHCYSGCGAGEIAGILIAVGIFALDNLWVAILTFILAYVAGFTMSMGPLIQEGASFKSALKDAVYSETATIFVMEIVAISVDLWLAPTSKISEPLFWSALIFSLTMGFIAAYPFNILLVKLGVKQGMHNPKESLKT